MTPIDSNGVPTGPVYEQRRYCDRCGWHADLSITKTYTEHWNTEHRVCMKGHPLVDYGVPCYVCAPELVPGPSAGKGWRV